MAVNLVWLEHDRALVSSSLGNLYDQGELLFKHKLGPMILV